MIYHEVREEVMEKVKELVKNMNGLSEEAFLNRYNTDPFFHKRFDMLVILLMEIKIYK